MTVKKPRFLWFLWHSWQYNDCPVYPPKLAQFVKNVPVVWEGFNDLWAEDEQKEIHRLYWETGAIPVTESMTVDDVSAKIEHCLDANDDLDAMFILIGELRKIEQGGKATHHLFTDIFLKEQTTL